MYAGRVLDKTQPEDRIHIKARLVKFSWQRGVKIGKGTHLLVTLTPQPSVLDVCGENKSPFPSPCIE